MILRDCVIHAAKTVRNLGVLQDSHLDGDAHISSIVRLCNFHLYQLAKVHCYISDEACCLAVLALVISRLDYCNTLLAGASQHQLEKLQRVQNRAARLVVRPHTPPGGVVHATQLCSDCTGFLYTSEFSTKFVYLFTTVSMLWVLPTCQNCYVQHHVRDCRLHQPSAMQLRQHQPRWRVR